MDPWICAQDQTRAQQAPVLVLELVQVQVEGKVAAAAQISTVPKKCQVFLDGLGTGLAGERAKGKRVSPSRPVRFVPSQSSVERIGNWRGKAHITRSHKEEKGGGRGRRRQVGLRGGGGRWRGLDVGLV